MAGGTWIAGPRELITAQELVRPLRNLNRTTISIICGCWHPIVAFLAILLTNTGWFCDSWLRPKQLCGATNTRKDGHGAVHRAANFWRLERRDRRME